MADKKISQLTAASQVNSDAVFPLSQIVSGSDATVKATVGQVGDYIADRQTHAGLNTTAKDLIGAINEIAAGGGGGGVIILKGTLAPTSGQGSNGQIYLKYEPITLDLEKISNVNNGNAYLTLDVDGTRDVKFVIKCNIHGGGTYATPIGARIASNDNAMLLFIKHEGSYATAKYDVGAGEQAFGDTTSFIDKDVTITLSGTKVRLEDEQGNYIEKTFTTSPFGSPAMTLFNLLQGSSIYGAATACYMDLYWCKVFYDGKLVKYLLPQTNNNNIGLVDIFTGDFFAGQYLTGTSKSTPLTVGVIQNTYAKVNGAWQDLIGTDIDDVSTGVVI